MSGKATGWVYDNSPYVAGTFAVHCAIGDSVDDMHDFEFFMSQPKLARKARVSEDTVRRALTQMVKDGALELLIEATPRKPARYRLILDFSTGVATRDLRGRSHATPGVATGRGVPLYRNEERTRAGTPATPYDEQQEAAAKLRERWAKPCPSCDGSTWQQTDAGLVRCETCKGTGLAA